MAEPTTSLKRIWKNEYFQTILMIALMVVIVFGFWYGSQFVLRTQYPALAVVSTSMLPTLNVGDVIIVQGVPASEIKADYLTGDIVVFRNPNNPDYRIVHRAVDIENRSNGIWITTHGDNNPTGFEERFHENYLIGKVVARIPYIGNFALFINSLGPFYYFIIILIIIINILLSLAPHDEEKKLREEEEPPKEKRKLFGKLSLEMFFFIILNALLIGFVIFNLLGSFTFWQIGAEPPQYVTVRGMYSDLQYQFSYGEISGSSFNNVTQAFLFNGFMTYQLDCLVSGNVRLGVPAFSWAQASIIILLLVDIWIVDKYLHFGKKIKQALKRGSP